MASIFRRPYTDRAGRKRRTKTWYAQWTDGDGGKHRVSLKTANKSAAQLKLAKLLQEREADPFQLHRRTPLAEHLAAWEQSLSGRVAAVQVQALLNRVRRVVDGCRWTYLADVDSEKAEAFLASLRVNHKHKRQAASIQTRNAYVASLKQFFSWMVERKRIAASPVACLRRGNAELDRRHERRPFTADELSRIMAAARSSTRVKEGMTGLDREAAYLVACMTGLRAKELSGLTPQSFDLAGAVVTLPASRTKNRKAARQPLPAAVCPTLATYLRTKPAGKPVWPGRWWRSAAEMLRVDLAAAGIPYALETAEGTLYGDFHSLRGSYILLLEKAGLSVREAMQLARHSDPKLTLKVYGKLRESDLHGAINRVGTDLTPAGDKQGAPEHTTGQVGSAPEGPKTLEFATKSGESGPLPEKALPAYTDILPVDASTLSDADLRRLAELLALELALRRKAA